MLASALHQVFDYQPLSTHSVAPRPALSPPCLNLHWSPCQIKEEELREWNVGTILQANRLGANPGSPTGIQPPRKRFLKGRGILNPQCWQMCWRWSYLFFMGEPAETWFLNGDGRMVTAHCHRTLRTPGKNNESTDIKCTLVQPMQFRYIIQHLNSSCRNSTQAVITSSKETKHSLITN